MPNDVKRQPYHGVFPPEWVDRGGSLGSAIDDAPVVGGKLEYTPSPQGYRCSCGLLFGSIGAFAMHAQDYPRHRLEGTWKAGASDPVNHPPHYTFGKFEVIDVIEDWGLPFHLAQVLKYVARSRHKGNELEDLKKARWFLDRLISQIEKK